MAPNMLKFTKCDKDKIPCLFVVFLFCFVFFLNKLSELIPPCSEDCLHF